MVSGTPLNLSFRIHTGTPVKPSVVFLTRAWDPLGTAGQLPHWVQELRANGYAVQVATWGAAERLKSPVQLDELSPVHIPVRGREIHGWKRLASWLKQQDPEVLHCWDCPAIVWWLARKFPGRIVETKFRAPRLESTRWLRRRLRKSDLLLTHDDSLLADTGPISRDQAVIPKSPVACRSPDRQRIREEILMELGLPENAVLVVASAELVPATRCKDLIWATDLLRCVRDDVHLLLFGVGPQRSQLERYARSTEASAHVHFLGRRASAPDWVAAADVFWQADLTQFLPEGILLAADAGVPFVAAFGANTSRLVRHQQTSLAIRAGARDQLARWTKFLLEQSERRQQLTRQAQSFVGAAFPQAALKSAIRQIYPPQKSEDALVHSQT